MNRTANITIASQKSTTLLIVGLRNNGCREAVANALERVRDVKNVQVNLYRTTATISHGSACIPETLIQAVEAAGYGASITHSDRTRERTKEHL